MSVDPWENQGRAYLAAPWQADAKNSLNNRQVLLRLCKQFFQEVLEAFRKSFKEPLVESGRQAARDIEEISVRYGNILCGLDPTYKAVPEWTGEDLAEFILKYGYARSEDATKSEPQRVLKSYFLYFAMDCCRKTRAHSSQKMTDMAYQSYVDDILTRMVNDLSGVVARG